jgi:hypothetical protein
LRFDPNGVRVEALQMFYLRTQLNFWIACCSIALRFLLI